jgi:hypothetical protein
MLGKKRMRTSMSPSSCLPPTANEFIAQGGGESDSPHGLAAHNQKYLNSEKLQAAHAV